MKLSYRVLFARICASGAHVLTRTLRSGSRCASKIPSVLQFHILAFTILFSPQVFAADKDSCVHVCAAICTSAQTAAVAKFDCKRKPHHVCYDDYGTCATAPNGRCAWQKDDKLVDCVSDKIGQSAADVMK